MATETGNLSPGYLVTYQRQNAKSPRLKMADGPTGYTHLKYAKTASAAVRVKGSIAIAMSLFLTQFLIFISFVHS